MITDKDRKLVIFLVKIKAFYLYNSFRNIQVGANWGFGWLLKRIKKRQTYDRLKHAPCCPANHFHKQRLIFQKCTCGAWEEMR